MSLFSNERAHESTPEIAISNCERGLTWLLGISLAASEITALVADRAFRS
jgi:hypothetical protein